MCNFFEKFTIKYKLTGHLFENRYTAQLIEDERYFLDVRKYIHLNPVKAQMVRNPLEYKYSSYELFVDPTKSSAEGKKNIISGLISDMVKTEKVLDAFRNNPREQYRMFVEGRISHSEQEMLIQKDMKEDDMWLPW